MKIIRQFESSRWSKFVETHPHGNIFQTPEMYNVYNNTKNYDPLFLGVLDSNQAYIGTLLAVVQKEYFRPMDRLTSRSIIWGGPLIKDNDPETYRKLLDEYDRIINRKVIYTQVRNLWDISESKGLFTERGYTFEEHLNILIDLAKSEDQLWSELHKKRRNEIRRASKEGTTVKGLAIKGDIQAAYRILSEVYRAAKLPIAHRSLFLSAWEELASKNMIKYLGAYNGDRLIGVICMLCYKSTIIDWYAGSLKNYLNTYPNDLLPWEAFIWGKSQDYLLFDFGGAGRPDKKYGVRDYKKKFGGEFVNFGRFEKIHKPATYLLGKTGFKIWQMIKN